MQDFVNKLWHFSFIFVFKNETKSLFL